MTFYYFFLSVRAGAKVVIASNEGNNPAVSRENLSSRFPTRSDTNRAVQPQNMARGLPFRICEVDGLYLSI